MAQGAALFRKEARSFFTGIRPGLRAYGQRMPAVGVRSFMDDLLHMFQVFQFPRKHYNRFKLNQEGPVAEIKTKDAMGLFYTFKADGEEKLLSTYVADPSDRYALQWLYEDFRLVDRQPFPMLMDVQVLKNGNPEGGVKIHYSRIQLDEPLKLDFSVPSKYKRITFAQVLKTITNLNQ